MRKKNDFFAFLFRFQYSVTLSFDALI